MTQVWESEITLPLGKIGKSRTIDVTKFTPTILDHVFSYGLRQLVNDAMASGENASDKEALADKRIANLLAGTLRASAIREGDPIRAEAIKIATQRVEAAIRKTHNADPAKCPKLADWKASDVRARALALIDKDPAIMAIAKANVEATQALDVEVDLDL